MSRAYAVVLALVAFSMFAVASPLSETKEMALAQRHNGVDSLDCILNVLIDLKVQIIAILDQIKLLKGKGDCSGLIGQIIVLINGALAAIVEIGVVVNLSDTVKIGVIAKVCADILIAIQAHIGVFAKIAVNVAAVVQLDLCLQAFLVQLNVCIVGVLSVIAPLCAGISVHVNLVLSVVLGVLGLL
ncbi:hypothetical protein EXIGLDRAFT_832798 [Exidia glandulosa HHB12029]|uniref:Transmembrane protein n=1 Tax=Exidia glandulosa HHB12029 TaxID=1314781 RepID=A0A165L920_EXIGL|nr:hypothetical protein EXIGLDRAFT_832798 [Exidia glandulosa HHB12029]